MNFADYLPNFDFLNRNLSWIIQVFVVVFFVLLINAIQRRALERLQKKLLKTANIWDDAILDVVRKPLSLLIWIVGIAFAAEIVHKETGAPIFAAVTAVRDMGMVVVVTWFLVRLVRTLETRFIDRKQAEGKKVDPTTVDAVGKLLRASVIITGILVGLQSMGFSISGILAFGGIGGIAVGFAAKDLLANFFGGLTIYMDRPFSKGDWVRSPDRNIEGTVEAIGWRLTRIRTFDKRPLYVPNSTFTTIVVENPSRMTHRRIYETIGVRYDDADKVNEIVTAIKDMLKGHEQIDTTQTLIVNFNAFGASSLDFFVYTFTKTTNWIRYHEVKHDVMLRIYDIITRHGADVAFPTRTLHVPEALQFAGMNESQTPALSSKV